MKNIYYYDTAIGKIGIAEEEGWITNVILEAENFQEECIQEETELLQKAAEELREYVEGSRKIFDLPLRPQGTPFLMVRREAIRTLPML